MTKEILQNIIKSIQNGDAETLNNLIKNNPQVLDNIQSFKVNYNTLNQNAAFLMFQLEKEENQFKRQDGFQIDKKRQDDQEDKMIRVFNVLVKAGLDFKHKDSLNQTIMQQASKDNRPKVIEWLFDLGLEIDPVDMWHQTPMYYCCKHGAYEAFRVLANLGANVEFLDANKETPIFQSFSNVKTDFIRKVLSEFSVCIDKEDHFKQLPLHQFKKNLTLLGGPEIKKPKVFYDFQAFCLHKMEPRKAETFLENALYSMKETIQPLVERYRQGLVAVSENKEVKKVVIRNDKSIKIHKDKEYTREPHDPKQITISRPSRAEPVPKPSPKVYNEHETQQPFEKASSERIKPSESKELLKETHVSNTPNSNTISISKPKNDDSNKKKSSNIRTSSKSSNEMKQRKFRLFKYEENDIFRKEELTETELSDIITTNKEIEKLLSISLDEVKFYLKRLNICDLSITQWGSIKEVDETQLKMAISEKMEDVLNKLDADQFAKMLDERNWQLQAIKVIENIINSTQEGFNNKKNLGYQFLDQPWNQKEDFELSEDNYRSVIRSPMCQKEVLRKLKSNEQQNKSIVGSLQEFCQDIQLIFRNCEFYNSYQDSMLKMSSENQEEFENQLELAGFLKKWGHFHTQSRNRTFNINSNTLVSTYFTKASEAQLEAVGDSLTKIHLDRQDDDDEKVVVSRSKMNTQAEQQQGYSFGQNDYNNDKMGTLDNDKDNKDDIDYMKEKERRDELKRKRVEGLDQSIGQDSMDLDQDLADSTLEKKDTQTMKDMSNSQQNGKQDKILANEDDEDDEMEFQDNDINLGKDDEHSN